MTAVSKKDHDTNDEHFDNSNGDDDIDSINKKPPICVCSSLSPEEDMIIIMTAVKMTLMPI